MSATTKLIAAGLLGISAACLAHSVPAGSYSAWTAEEKAQAATAINSICAELCAPYVRSAMNGSARASYEAAACITASFANNLPDDYPQLDQLRQATRENHRQAKLLGTERPIPLVR